MKRAIVKTENVTKDIINSSKAIRKKYKKLKMAESMAEDELNKTFKPIIEPLNKIINSKKNVIKTEEAISNIKIDSNPGAEYDEIKPSIDIPAAQDIFVTPKGRYEAKLRAKNLGPFAERYVLMHLEKEKEKDLDKVYGIRSDGQRWLLGDSNISIADDKIHINDKTYNGTPGLFELLFLKNPDKEIYNAEDLKVYKKLLLSTNAYKQGYEASRQTNSNRGQKYKTIIQPLLQQDKKGSGMNIHTPRFEYWDDPNELVDRLRLLLASQAAGNNSHNNEVLSLIEELKEASIIE